MKALILGAGYAVRLRPLTLNNPKPLLQVGRKRILDWIMDELSAVGDIDRVYIVTNGKFFDRFRQWQSGSDLLKETLIINDGTESNETRLGAIRDIELAIEEARIDDDLLVVAGDNLFELKLGEFVNFARSKRDGVTVALHNVESVDLAKKYGVVKVRAEDCKVVGFEEKPAAPQSTLVSTCIYYFPREKLGLVKRYLAASQKADAPGNYISWLCKNQRVYGFCFDGYWCDIGDVDSYKRADQRYKRRD